jgi:hypothetical protein
METAWRILLNFEAWNPTFVGATVTRVRGNASSVGEILLITKTYSDPKGEAFPEYYAETIKVVPGRRIVWYCYAKDGLTYHGQKDPFRNFVDFGLTSGSNGVRFNINYYAQNRQSADRLAREREFMESTLQEVAAAFSSYCQRDSRT